LLHSREMTVNSSLPLVIVNPGSAGGSTESRWARIASDLRDHFGAFEVAFTRGPGDAIDIARTAGKDGRNFVIACGGDGTINEVANGILESEADVELGILPSGTGGDFRRSLNISAGIREAASQLRGGAAKTIDVGSVTFTNFEDRIVRRFFLNVSSFGLSASVIGRVKAGNKLSWVPARALRGKAAFAVSTIQEVVDLDFTTIRLSIDGGDEKLLNTVNFCVANARYFGGGMKIAPGAVLDDGLFDVVNIGNLNTARILMNAARLYRGSHLEMAEVNHTHARKIEVRPVRAGEEILIEVDGELPGRLPAVYQVVPNALRVRVPRGT
jgi:diacylglycerol kinase (ATP)